MKKFNQILRTILIIFIAYIAIIIIIQAFINPELTGTQLLLKLPDSIMWKFT